MNEARNGIQTDVKWWMKNKGNEQKKNLQHVREWERTTFESYRHFMNETEGDGLWMKMNEWSFKGKTEKGVKDGNCDAGWKYPGTVVQPICSLQQ